MTIGAVEEALLYQVRQDGSYETEPPGDVAANKSESSLASPAVPWQCGLIKHESKSPSQMPYMAPATDGCDVSLK